MKILCLIPARSGSKGIKNKNIKELNGKPLIAYTIEQAINTKYKMKIIVSTDSQEYADISKKYGAEVPFLRPKEISGDLSTDIEFIKHCVDWLKHNQDYIPDIILQLRVTSPLRKVDDINKSLEIFINNFDKYDSLRSVYELDKTPYKMYHIEKNNLIPIIKNYNNLNEPFNCGRQNFPKTYIHNGYIDILKTSLLNDNLISGKNILPYVMNKNDNIDLDNIDDWEKLIKHINK